MRTNHRWGWVGIVALVALAGGCTPANEFPSDIHGRYEMSRLLGTDNVTIAVDRNSLTMTECDINCPELVMRFTKIECTEPQAGMSHCTVESADCTGTIEEAAGVTPSLEVSLTVKPGATGEALEQRQINCYQHSGNITRS